MTSLSDTLREARRRLRAVADLLERAPLRSGPDGADARVLSRPVLLLHGLTSTRRSAEVLERRLRRDGYAVFTLRLGGLARGIGTRGIDDLAAEVRAEVERLCAEHPGMGSLTLIGHSRGGLVGAYYVKKLGGWRRACALVTLGTPHHGTPAAWVGLPLGVFARSLWQMTPRSRFIRRLERGAWPPGVRFVSLFSKRDRVARFPSTLIETHGLPYLRNVEVDAPGHRDLLTRKRVYDVLLAELRAGEAAAPVRIGKLTAIPGAARSSSAR
ncbi:MAG: esterase/lipase family protein [Anaeromyxobacteraceae bacterium]